MVKEYHQYICEICGRYHYQKHKAEACEKKKPYPPDFEIGDKCVISIDNGHKKDAYICEVVGMKIVKHQYVRLLKIGDRIPNPYESEYELTKEQKEWYGPH